MRLGPRGFTLIELAVVIAIIAVLAAIAIPGIMQSQRVANERSALTSLKSIPVAEYDFQGNDRDRNGVRDFWTGDLAGLYSLTGADIPGNNDAPVRLLDLAYAASDSIPLVEGGAGGEYRAIQNFTQPAPKAGYWVFALELDAQGAPLKMDTGGGAAMGAVHNFTEFGFLTYPVSYGSTGSFAGIIGQEAVVYKRRLTQDITPGMAEFSKWPNSTEISNSWQKND